MVYIEARVYVRPYLKNRNKISLFLGRDEIST